MSAVHSRREATLAADVSHKTPAPVEFADLLAATGSKYAYCRDSLVLRPKAGSEVIACRGAVDEHVFSGLIDRFSAQYPEADRRAVVSMWTLYYFSILSIAVAVLGLELQRLAPVALDEVSLCIDPETACPQAFLLPHLGPEVTALPIEKALHPLLALHIEPMIAALAKHCGVGRGLLWTNAAAYLDWIVAEIGRQSDRPNAAAEAELYQQPAWPSGAKNPVHGLIRPQRDKGGEIYGRRRVCCLRYGLAGVGGCGLACPLPKGQS